MFVRLFVNSKNDSQTRSILRSFIKKFHPILKSQEIQKIEAYWKIENAYVVEIDLSLLDGTSEVELNKVLMSISDRWLKFGSPTNEFLASETTEGCKYILNGLIMVNIHLE
ncbi:hypothetical protein [Paenalkalicoccus suaedae]|uniref:hypothetical protein n=1 Tax=Paenalkalicoccus suaedae TaxID=2592382 RepID=UPI00158DF545|nr:hypothetical protein [Paenalkalicoccus suaedae]